MSHQFIIGSGDYDLCIGDHIENSFVNIYARPRAESDMPIVGINRYDVTTYDQRAADDLPKPAKAYLKELARVSDKTLEITEELVVVLAHCLGGLSGVSKVYRKVFAS